MQPRPRSDVAQFASLSYGAERLGEVDSIQLYEEHLRYHFDASPHMICSAIDALPAEQDLKDDRVS
jgi:hypothetical protein